MRERGGNLVDLRDDATRKLRKQGRQMTRNAADWGDETTYKLRKQGRNLTRTLLDWGDDALYKLRKQGQYIAQNVADWGDEAAYKLRKQSQYVAQNLTGRKDDVTRKLRRQSRSVTRNLADRREMAARKLRRQSRDLTQTLADRGELTARKLRRQSRHLARRGGEALEPGRANRGKLWTIMGFFAGLLVAGGITYWLVKRGLGQREMEEEQGIELPQRDTLNGTVSRPGGEIRYASQGGTAVASRTSTTSAGPGSKFVGVLSTRQYYPIEQQPSDVSDLVFFETEDDARAEGFTAGA